MDYNTTHKHVLKKILTTFNNTITWWFMSVWL